SVPTDAWCSVISESWTCVARPVVNRSSAVAIGSRVPEWRTFLIRSWRRTSATTSCEVIPSALATDRTPSGAATDNITNCLQDFIFDLGERTGNARAGSQHMPAAAKFFADGTHIHLFAF